MAYDNPENLFQVYLNSADAVRKSGNGTVCSFNLQSVLDQAPAAQDFAKESVCMIKVLYFTISQIAGTATYGWDAQGVSTVQIRLNNAYPNNIETNPITAANSRSVISSDIIGVVPVGNSTFTYSNQYYDNHWVSCGNPLRGEITITLTDQDATPITGALNEAGDNWNMVIQIYYPRGKDQPNNSVNLAHIQNFQ